MEAGQPWNPATSVTLAPGASKTYGVKFLVSDEIRNIEKTLAADGRPVAVGIPGYVLPMDIDGRLFLKYPKGVKSMEVEPKGAIAITGNKATAGGWKAYTLQGKTWGRARLTVSYEDGLVQSIHYFVTKPQADAVADLGRFLTTRQWFVDANDPFKRSPSVMSLRPRGKQDRPAGQPRLDCRPGRRGRLRVLADRHHEAVRPARARRSSTKYQQFIDNVLWGGLQYKDGPRQYGVRKSLFYYQPDELPPNYYRSDLNWGSWTSWKKVDAERVDRSYQLSARRGAPLGDVPSGAQSRRAGHQPPLGLVFDQRLPDGGGHDEIRRRLCALRPDGRGCLRPDPA